VFGYYVQSPYYVSNIETGTAPFTVTSTTLNTNLNADLLDGKHGSSYQPALNGTGFVKISGTTISYDNSTYLTALHTIGVLTGQVWGYDSHPTTTTGYGLPAYPTTLPASDVSAWAKAGTKPSYNTSEISENTNLYYTDVRVDARVVAGITGKQNTITTGATSQYFRGDLSLATFPTVGTWGALAYPTWSSGTPFVKMTAAGTFALDANTYSTNIHSNITALNAVSGTNTGDNAVNSLYSGLVTMTYPGAGIPLSTGSAWGTSITNNSSNWNTAYGWGNHANLYLPLAGGSLSGGVKMNYNPIYMSGDSSDPYYLFQNSGWNVGMDYVHYSGHRFFVNANATPSFTITNNGAATFASSVTATNFVKSNGTSAQYLMADGSVTTSTGSMVYPGAGIALSTGSAWGTSITNNSANWNTAYDDRMKWDGGSTGLTAATGRTSLGLGNSATKDTGTTTGTVAAGDDTRFGIGGTYTPVYSLLTNTSSCTTSSVMYTRVGNVVHVALSGYFSPDAANVLSFFSVSIPVAISGNVTVAGVGNISSYYSSVRSQFPARIVANGGLVNFSCLCPITAAYIEFYMQFDYIVN